MAFLSYPDYKRYLILNLIHRCGPISRTRLAELTDYIPAVITGIVKELMDAQLVIEKGSAYAGQGRRRALLQINNDYICAVGISISEASVLMVVSDLGGNLLQREAYPLQPGCAASEVVDTVLNNLPPLLEAFSDRKILGIGICDPGVLDPHSGRAISSVRFSDWGDVHLQEAVQTHTGLPVRVASGNVVWALAEQRYGAAQGLQDFVGIGRGKGIGMSFVTNGLVVKGHNSFAGEIGHTVVQESDALCYCGNRGCVEQTAALPYIRNEISRALRQGVHSVLRQRLGAEQTPAVSDIRWALDQGDKLCMHIVQEAAARIGVAVANVVNLLDPACVVFYGELVALGDVFLNAIKRAVCDHTLFMLGKIDFRVSALMENAEPIGAATMLFADFLKSDNFKWLAELPDGAEGE